MYWTVLSEPFSRKGHLYVQARCVCGVEKAVMQSRMRSGYSKSCGCKADRRTMLSHGKHHTKVYKAWNAMWTRCTNENYQHWDNYGGRGICVDPRWKDFEAFYKDMGDPPTATHSLDRINNDGNYTVTNCRWASTKEQGRNRRTNRMLTAFGKTLMLIDWPAEFGIAYGTIQARLRMGWSDEDAVSRPVRTKSR